MQDLLNTMRRLRAPDGCPWDREQTHESLRPYLLEEAAEAADAAGTPDFPEELGDVLLQVAFHAVIGEEQGTFTYADIERSVTEKLVRRHPHVFGDVVAEDAAAVEGVWAAVKRAEEKEAGRPRSLAAQIPSALGALERERQLQRKVGQPAGSRRAVEQALGRAPDTPAGVAEVLAAAVAWARAAGVNPEVALRERTAQALRAADVPPGSGPEEGPEHSAGDQA